MQVGQNTEAPMVVMAWWKENKERAGDHCGGDGRFLARMKIG